MIRIRRRAVGLIGGALLLFLAGTNIQSGWLFALSSLLLGAVAGGAMFPLLMIRGLRVERRAQAEGFVGDQVPVDLVVENLSRGARLSLVIRDPHVAPTTAFVPAIRAGERVILRTVRPASRRGLVQDVPVEVASSAPFGMAEARRRVQSTGRTVIFPRVFALDPLPVLAGWRERPSLHDPGAQRGDGLEFLGVREYRQGDSPRNVHWPSTARRGSLVVREMELERPGGLLILVDTWADAGSGETVLDLCCAVAASVVVEAAGSGHDLMAGAAQGGTADPPAPMGRREALTWLAALAAPGGMPLAAVLDQTETAPDTALLIVAPSWRTNTASALEPRIAGLVRTGGPVVVALIDAARFDSGKAALAPSEMARLEKALALSGAEVRRIGAFDEVGPALGRRAPARPLPSEQMGILR